MHSPAVPDELKSIPGNDLFPSVTLCRLLDASGASASMVREPSSRSEEIVLWEIRSAMCEHCSVPKLWGDFSGGMQAKLVRRVQRWMSEKQPAGRGRGLIRCLQCVEASLQQKLPKSRILEEVVAGRLSGQMTMSLCIRKAAGQSPITMSSSMTLGGSVKMKECESHLWASVWERLNDSSSHEDSDMPGDDVMSPTVMESSESADVVID